MTFGASLFLIAVGLILKFAVTAELAGIDINVIGLILVGVGLLGLLLGLFLYFNDSRRGVARDDRDVVREEEVVRRERR